MTRAWAFVALALIGCDRWRTCEELVDWHVPFEREDGVVEHEGAQGVLTRGRDGSLILHINDPSPKVKFGTLHVGGSALARINRDGELVGLVPTPDVVGQATAVAADAQGNAYLVSGADEAAGGLKLTSYNGAFQVRWTVTLLGNLGIPSLAADDAGHVAVLGPSPSGMSLYYLETDGTQRWSVPNPGIGGGLGFDDEGNVHLFTSNGTGLEHRRYTPDGVLAATHATATGHPAAIMRDGGFVAFDFFTDDTIHLARFDRDGARLWQREVPATNIDFGFDGQVKIATSDEGDVLVSTDDTAGPTPGSRVIRLDGKTGDSRSDRISCTSMVVVGADADAYYAIGQPGFASVGIARFSY